MPERPPRALTIAGSDSGGGAGIQADLKTFTALGVFGMSAVTAITAQNTVGIAGMETVPARFVEMQIAVVAADIGIDAAKTGMLAERGIVEAVARAVERHRIERLVVDPVFLAKDGTALLAEEAVESLAHSLFPLALVVTPNAAEASRLAGIEVKDRESQRRAAREIARLGPRYVLVKGGHLEEPDEATDVLWDGENFEELKSRRIAVAHTHGTGCTLSAAIAAYLALGETPRNAVRKAKEFVTGAIEHSLAIGKGVGPVDPAWNLRRAATGKGRE